MQKPMSLRVPYLVACLLSYDINITVFFLFVDKKQILWFKMSGEGGDGAGKTWYIIYFLISFFIELYLFEPHN